MTSADEVEEIELRLFLEAIYARYGYDLRGYAATSMRRRVIAVLAKSGLGHLGELQHRVVHDSAFFTEVLHDLTIHVSEMFRDPELYRTFRTEVVPVLRTYPLIRIWHAGCAAGEEAYASAIVLCEEDLYDRAQIYATDLSLQAVAQAKQGVYEANQVADFSDNYEKAGGTSVLSRYYTMAYDRIAMIESLRRNILFFHHDLVSDHVFGEMHVIFCRNVLIYFAHDLRDQVLHKFAASLCAGGFLCLGRSEGLPRGGSSKEFAEFSVKDRIYRHIEATR